MSKPDEVLDAIARAVAPLVADFVRDELERDPPKRRLYTLRELDEMGGWDTGFLLWMIRSRRAELVKAGALVEGNPHRIDPELVEKVARGWAKPSASSSRELKRAS